tara:strand:- start:11261 stop:11659 length:399 start_codon:yes stop_codon:yes gene_type:complete
VFSKTIIIGNLGADPEPRTTQTGTQVTKLRVAVKAERKGEETEWWTCTCFGQSAEYAAKYLTKGQQVLVEGRTKINKWQDKKTGQERMAIELIARTVKGGTRPIAESPSSYQPTHEDRIVRMPYSDEEEVPF